jgi:competence protein ComEC
MPPTSTRVALAYGAGLGAVLLAPRLPSVLWTGLVAATAAAMALVAWRTRREPWASLAGVAAGLMAGLLATHGALDHRLPVALEGVDGTLTGVIADLPQTDTLRTRVRVDVERLVLGGRAVPGPRQVTLSWYGAHPELRAGQRWQWPVRLKAPRGFVNPSGFDYERWLTGEGIDATGYVAGEAKPLSASLLTAPVQRLRQVIAGGLDRHLGSGDAAGVVRGLAIGVDNAVSARTWRTLRDTGTAHLLAISGLHVALCGLVVYALTVRVWAQMAGVVRRVPAPRAAAVAAAVAVFGYAALAGFAVPARRTALMFAVAALGAASGRQTSSGSLLLLAGAAVLLFDPLAPLASGFWLSFGAVAILLWIGGGRGRARPLEDAQPAGYARRAWHAATHSTVGALRLQVAITLALLPLTLGFFGQLSASAVPANLIAVPLLGLVAVPLTLLGVLALPLPPLAGVLLHAAEWVCGVTLALLAALRQVMPALSWPPVPWPLLAVSAVGVLVLLAPRGFPGRWLGVLWCLPAVLYRPPVPVPGAFVATVLDVGQGLSVVVRTEHHALVYDSGPRFSERFSAGDAIVLPELTRLGARRLDLLLLSHGDADHAGAAADIVAGIRTARVVSGTPDRIRGVQNVEPCVDGASWTWDGVRFDQFAPGADLVEPRANDLSCVLRVQAANGTSALLTGDVELLAQARLLQRLPAGRVDVLLAPHHGSRGALYAPLIARLAPQEVIFSAGYRSRFGHPHASVVVAYRAAGARLWNTATAGALVVGVGAGPVHVRAQRAAEPRWWRPGADPAP